MPTLPQRTAARLRAHPSRLFWPGLLGGVIGGLAIQLAFMLLTMQPASVSGVSPQPDAGQGTAAMICACLAGFVSAGITAEFTRRVLQRHVALNAYVSWAAANAIFIANVGLTTNAMV